MDHASTQRKRYQPSVSPTNSNIGSSLREESSFGDVATNSANPDNSKSQFGSPLSSDNTGEGSRPSLPGEVGTQPTTSGQSNSGIGDALSSLGNFEDGTSRNSDNPGSGELAAVGSPLQDFGGSRGRPTKPSSGSGSSSGDGSGGVSCIDCPQPDYPSLAREEGLEGNPKLRIDIDFDGNVTNVYIEKSSGHTILDEAAIEAVKEWKLDPKDGGRLGVLVTLKFRLR
nr:energy transducer TonB [Okeania sp. SIO2F4]